eukprot:scaffold92442_cov65-Attheya_sp.AAC.1
MKNQFSATISCLDFGFARTTARPFLARNVSGNGPPRTHNKSASNGMKFEHGKFRRIRYGDGSILGTPASVTVGTKFFDLIWKRADGIVICSSVMGKRMMYISLTMGLTGRTKTNTMGNSGINVADSVESRIHMAGTGMILIGCQEGVDGSKIGASASCQPVEHTNGRTMFLLKTLAILGRHVDIGNTIDGKARPIGGTSLNANKAH